MMNTEDKYVSSLSVPNLVPTPVTGGNIVTAGQTVFYSEYTYKETICMKCQSLCFFFFFFFFLVGGTGGGGGGDKKKNILNLSSA